VSQYRRLLTSSKRPRPRSGPLRQVPPALEAATHASHIQGLTRVPSRAASGRCPGDARGFPAAPQTVFASRRPCRTANCAAGDRLTVLVIEPRRLAQWHLRNRERCCLEITVLGHEIEPSLADSPEWTTSQQHVPMCMADARPCLAAALLAGLHCRRGLLRTLGVDTSLVEPERRVVVGHQRHINQ
jgi:hypothetical protein